MEKSTITSSSLQPMATVGYWAEAQLPGPRWRPMDGPCRWCTARVHLAHSHRAERSQRPQRGELTAASPELDNFDDSST
jgi:hypothetical protein